MTTLAEFETLCGKVRNWGRWGADDQRGTLNLIDRASLRRGLAAVETGEALSLSMPWQLKGPQDGSGIPGRINPVRTMLGINTPMGPDPAAAYSDDIVVMPLQAATHWDALSHVSWRGRMYNDVAADAVSVAGAARLAIDTFGPVVTRGILLDVARLEGADRLPGGFEVTAAHLDACARDAGIEVRPGDIALVRTGHIQLFHAGDIHGYHTPTPGLGIDTAAWFHEHGVAAAATDTIAFELLPARCPELVLPLHVLCLVMMGMPQGQNFDFEELSRACAADGRYTFLFEATPLPFRCGTGGPINPVAVR
ncbi:cyclase family protein [Streptomyces mexicanus]|uniref:cyclase family protein n=1 Tax=Streptomyces mexicanus TaxID=178566 RepID=UPI00135B0EDE|nr:cyclase family protein [Streptomyces mexicanus]